MVIEFVVATLVSVVVGVLDSLLPTDANPAALGEVVGGFIPYYTWANSWLPVSEGIELAILSLQVTLVIGGIYAAHWVLVKLHILGGSS